MNKYIYAFCFLMSAFIAHSQQEFKLAFYNVENLFDLTDNPKTLDDEFLPEGAKKWTDQRYQTKLTHLSRVLDSIGNIQFLGLAEVENKKVVEDLLNTPAFAKNTFDIVHFDSPDRRGIDVAFAYNKKIFTVEKVDTIGITFPPEIEKDYTTRLILHIEGTLNDGSRLHFFVNHWPSRRGGEEKSQPKRLWVAAHLKREVARIFANNTQANIIIMGDFNDEPNNLSISSVLGALPAHQVQAIPGLLYNLFDQYDANNEGSYRYKGSWNMLDQIIVSGALIMDGKTTLSIEHPAIFHQGWMMYKNSKHGETPSRTYGGKRYFGGYSDHLPVSVTFHLN